MNPLSLREICAKATPDIPLIPKTAEHMALALAAGHARQQLAARFSPETMLIVALALRDARKSLAAIQHKDGYAFIAQDLADIDRALNLLDGRTEL